MAEVHTGDDRQRIEALFLTDHAEHGVVVAPPLVLVKRASWTAEDETRDST